MRKLRLDLDALVVETFQPAAEVSGAGTVHGAIRAGLAGSGDSMCENCASADPCTGIPIDTCTCGCDAGVGVAELAYGQPIGAGSGCAETSPCTCIPIDTCSCGAVAYPYP